MPRLTIVVAATRNNGIGRAATLPWRLPKEMSFFRQITSAAPEGSMNAVVMGRATWESIPKKFRPLPKRLNIVISRNTQYELMPSDAETPQASVYLQSSVESVAERLAQPQNVEKPLYRSFVVGGAHIYGATLALPPSSETFVDRILLTRVLSPAFEDCDVFFPDFLAENSTEVGQSGWRRASHKELKEWAGFDVPEGVQEENGVQYEFQMWVR
ncbi:dihydrofolate reductase [Trametes versicolor FP-101664 SS1]|uniref:dihydrofolate reductase n=1 Tax=Trametes versicolor (strain FP-101664) TaxID=717944 RepID=UPI0004623771|nr:dihydrofolate reductase [Trametes versicolor FP-101664 SS1]EIW64632.1 dihydrofolate reductase [Trametes versicolor FP-101664 SS1]